VEYFGGVLASSRANEENDDRGLRYSKMIEKMSAQELRLHFLVYSALRQSVPYHLANNIHLQRSKLEFFIPADSLLAKMYPSQIFDENCGTELSNAFYALFHDGLIEGRWRIGPKDSLVEWFKLAPSDGVIVQPSAPGVSLFLWAFGRGGKPLSEIFAEDFTPSIPRIDEKMNGVTLTKSN
jgi:hypothetical protein